MMKLILFPALVFLLVSKPLIEPSLAASPLGSPNPEATLDLILQSMDGTGQHLRSMKASLTQRKWTRILDRYDRGEKGTFAFLKDGDRVFLRKDVREPQESVLSIEDGRVTFYQPRIKQAQRYDLGERRDQAEFLLLGFGSEPETLKETYEIRLRGEEELEGTHTYVLELTPRSESISAHFTQIVLWVDSDLWVPIQQKLVEPTRDHLLIRFQDIELNPDLSRSQFEVRLPRDVTVVGRN